MIEYPRGYVSDCFLIKDIREKMKNFQSQIQHISSFDNLDKIKSSKYLCGVGVIESSSDQTPVYPLIPCCRRESRDTDLISKMVFFGFMAALFLADSPIKRSLSVKETKDGVVKLPCSLATGDIDQYKISVVEARFAKSIFREKRNTY